MKFFAQECATCKKRVNRSRGRINEAKKFGWRIYCSAACLKKALSKKREFRCARLSCGNTFFRAPHEILSAASYCSQSCAAVVNNSKYPKRKAHIVKCLYCKNNFKGTGHYCSRGCKNKSMMITAETISKGIENFFKNHGRIPLKREFAHYKAARRRFGSWNKAIEATGYKPNPVLFSNKHIAIDGHKCDSIAEKIIDDWLYEKNIKHERSVRYPDNPRLTADFVTTKCWIEFFGLSGEMRKYDALIKKKEKLAKKFDLPLVALHPNDLFPRNRLSEVLKI